MKSSFKLLAVAFAALGLSAYALPSITYTLGTGNTDLSGYPAPYGTITVTLNSTTTASVVFTGATTGGFTYKFGSNSAVDVNVNAASFATSNLVGPDLSFDGARTVDGFGAFSATFDNFDGSPHALSTMSFTLTNGSGTWATPGSVLTNNDSGFLAAAHIFVYNSDHVNVATGYAAADSTPQSGPGVPDESATVTLLGLGLIGLELLRRKAAAA
jgi:hypothetical protein